MGGVTTERYVLWDWNGTLLDDTAAAVAALNAMLARRGLPSVDLDFFRLNFAFPARTFYEKIGMPVPDSEWDALAREYYTTYAAQPTDLARGARAALEAVKARGARQGVLSALRQDLLEGEMIKYGLGGYFACVWGSDNLDGGSKLERGKELLRRLTAEGADPAAIVLIGDALHDHEVATALGIRCVLFGGGSHAYERLAAVAPTGKTLEECIELAWQVLEKGK